MILPTILLVLAPACTPDGIDKEQTESTSCEAGFILDDSTCVPQSCGTGRWGNLGVDEDTVYVDMTAVEGGDGTEEMPYTKIQPGLDRGSGRRTGCSGLTGLAMEGCLIEGNTAVGLIALNQGTQITLRDTVVRDTQPNDSGEGGRGIVVQDGATLSAEGCLIDGNTDVGLYTANPDIQVTLRKTTVKDTQPGTNRESGIGLQVTAESTLSTEGCLLERNTEYGLVVADTGTRVTLRDTIVKDTQPNAKGVYGLGIGVGSGATLSAEGCLIDGNTDLGLLALQNQSCSSLPDCYSEAPQQDFCPTYSYPTCYAEFFLMAMPADLVDWEEDRGSPCPRLTLALAPESQVLMEPLVPDSVTVPPGTEAS